MPLNLEIHHHHHFDPAVIALLEKLVSLEGKIMARLDDIAAEVTAQKTVVASVATLLQQLHDQLVSAGTDQAKLNQLAADIQANTDALSAAVVANTPAAPPAP